MRVLLAIQALQVARASAAQAVGIERASGAATCWSGADDRRNRVWRQRSAKRPA